MLHRFQDFNNVFWSCLVLLLRKVVVFALLCKLDEDCRAGHDRFINRPPQGMLRGCSGKVFPSGATALHGSWECSQSLGRKLSLVTSTKLYIPSYDKSFNVGLWYLCFLNLKMFHGPQISEIERRI